VSELEAITDRIKKEISESKRLDKGECWEPSPVLQSMMYSAIAISHKLEALLKFKE
jgi:hypothetical protein